MIPAALMPAALILAGSRHGADPVALSEGVAHKALILLDGRPLLMRVYDALKAAGITRIAICADQPEVVMLAQQLGAEVIAPGPGPSASVVAAHAQLGTPLLVTTADHALLRPEWVADFLADAPISADVAILLARRDTVEAAYPGSERTWLRFADGQWSGCNLFLIATHRGQAASYVWQQVEAERKRPWRIAAKLGLQSLWSYWRGHLTLAEALSRIGHRVGLQASMVAARNGLAAIDVDKPADLADVKRIIHQMAGSSSLTPPKPLSGVPDSA